MMDEQVKVFRSFEEADEDDRQRRKKMTSQERLEVLLELIRNYYGPSEGLERVYRVLELKQS